MMGVASAQGMFEQVGFLSLYLLRFCGSDEVWEGLLARHFCTLSIVYQKSYEANFLSLQ